MTPRPDLHARLGRLLGPGVDRARRNADPRRPTPQVAVLADGATSTYGGDRPFHCASVGKVFTAVLVARLVERGLLSFDTPIGDLVSSYPLSTLPAASGVDPARQITVEHLLTHRSGLPDPMEPPRGRTTECSLVALARRPERTRHLREVLDEMRGLPAVGRPGETFAYGDGGYALLLCAAEDVTGTPFPQLSRTEVFAPAGMQRTWHPHNDPATDLTDLDISPMWLGGADLGRTRALSVGSFDGGAVTTATDLLCFLRSLHDGALVARETVDHLARRRSRLRAGVHYGAGLATLRFGELMPVLLHGLPEPVGGLGLTGIHAFSYPDRKTHVVCAFHSTRAMNASFRTHITIARLLSRRQG